MLYACSAKLTRCFNSMYVGALLDSYESKWTFIEICTRICKCPAAGLGLCRKSQQFHYYCIYNDLSTVVIIIILN